MGFALALLVGLVLALVAAALAGALILNPRSAPHLAGSGNVDPDTVSGFGREWQKFTHGAEALSERERADAFRSYFDIFPWHLIGRDGVGADVGCGSGRWAVLVAPRVGRLLACDPSADALSVARANLAGLGNVEFHQADAGNLPIADASLDFAYCLGVLHHIPDPARALCDIARKLKPGAPLLVYIYYAFDNRPRWYRLLWQASNGLRLAIARLPYRLQVATTASIALLVYWPLARAGALLDRIGALPRGWPLAYYRHRSFYYMRTDSFDRFCTRLEHRFTRAAIERMLEEAGCGQIVFSSHEPFWCAAAIREPAGCS